MPVTLRKAVALAAYLAVEQRPFSREYLATLLWPDHGQESALANLRRTLSILRERLGNGCICGEADQLQIDAEAVTVDVHEFQSLLGSPVSATDLPSLEAAAELYRGSFLEGFSLGDCEEFDQWQDATRERVRSEYDALLGALTTRYANEGRLESALDAATKWMELDHLNEAAHRALMEIHARSGRTDRAHRQFESCVRMLRDERLEPDDLTLDLIGAIEKHRIASFAAGADSTPTRDPPAARRRAWFRGRAGIALAVFVVVSVLALASIFLVRVLLLPTDLSVAALEVYESASEFSSLRFALRNEGRAKRHVDYTVIFSSNPLVVAAREYVVYADTIRMGRNEEVTIELDRWRDIQEYLETRVVVAPGDYTVSVVIDPDHLHGDRSRFNNRLTRSSHFFFPGTAADAAFAVEIVYSGPGLLDHANPLEVYIGGRSYPQQFWDWGRFVVTRPGRYYFPVADIPRRDSHATGYFLAIVHSARRGNHAEHAFPLWPEQGEVAAIYREGPGNLTYGVFGVGIGTPVYPGRRYAVEFAPPTPPGPDAFEVDSSLEIGTVIDYDALPVRQHHTLHHEGTGDTDADWFRVMIRAGDSLTVETFSAGGLWECDTAIDIADSRGRFIRNAVDKSDDDLYSLLTYRNDTGTDQVFHVLVKPYRKYDRGVNVAGEYIVEFRR